jgi:uncharacterized protein YihD (DUF1040 family)
MRDINRIDKILDRLGSIWKANPDLRLTQLILNLPIEASLYYVEDEELIKILEDYYYFYNSLKSI